MRCIRFGEGWGVPEGEDACVRYAGSTVWMKFGLLGRKVFRGRIMRLFEEVRWDHFEEFATRGMLSSLNVVGKESQRKGDRVWVAKREERGVSDKIWNLFESSRPIRGFGGD